MGYSAFMCFLVPIQGINQFEMI